MYITHTQLPDLAARLMAERKRQGLSRSQAAAVSNVSPSFIRDAESAPERCSMGKLILLVRGLGLALEVNGWADDQQVAGLGIPTVFQAAPPETGAP